MSYDQGYWHTDRCSELDVAEEYVGTHIAVYVKWCLLRNFLIDDTSDKELALEEQTTRKRVRSGNMSANEYFENFREWNLT